MSEPLTFLNPDGSGTIITDEPIQCECGYMAAILVNRDGKTRCTSCDAKLLKDRRSFEDTWKIYTHPPDEPFGSI